MSDDRRQRPHDGSDEKRDEAEAPPAHELPVDPEFPADDNAPADERVEVITRPQDLPEESRRDL